MIDPRNGVTIGTYMRDAMMMLAHHRELQNILSQQTLVPSPQRGRAEPFLLFRFGPARGSVTPSSLASSRPRFLLEMLSTASIDRYCNSWQWP